MQWAQENDKTLRLIQDSLNTTDRHLTAYIADGIDAVQIPQEAQVFISSHIYGPNKHYFMFYNFFYDFILFSGLLRNRVSGIFIYFVYSFIYIFFLCTLNISDLFFSYLVNYYLKIIIIALLLSH